MVAALLLAALSGNALVWYDFESDGIETGPYTISIFEGASGSVSLSSLYRYSGFRSVEIRDVAGDGEFAELQGFFSDRWSGRVLFHFALLVAEPGEPFNVALAGVSHFSMREHGIGFWLKGQNGSLYQVSAGRDELLLEIEPFTWYAVDVVYDVDRGRYDLTIRAEGREEPVVLRRDSENAVGIPGSELRKYSFIGDIPGVDRSNARFYVDDVLVQSDVPVEEPPFVAPGRRLLFVDLFDRYQASLLETPGCVPVLSASDFGFAPADLTEAARAGIASPLEWNAGELPRGLSPFLERLLSAVADWRAGCSMPSQAVESFERAARSAPEGKIHEMSEVLALASRGRWSEADELLMSIYPLWQDDPRLPALLAAMGLARKDLEEAERWTDDGFDPRPQWLDSKAVAALWSEPVGPRLVDALKAEFPSQWHDLIRARLTAEIRFFVLLWQKRFPEALAYARRMAALQSRMKLSPGNWLERAGDASFHEGDYAGALAAYEESRRSGNDAESILLKLSDVHFKLGNFELERSFREKVYGRLE
jgi:tetratricopeptide (TPR) repeat protein